ncbi:MAG: proline--tRNA ligase [Vampirovibrionales bacterium]|nr:proline--tRNA ligase [Vampirovibrionales bacterium]
MDMSRLLATTLRETPADAEVVSHQLLARAGYIRRLAGGLYNLLPLMKRVVRKVETIVREEMDAAGAQELLMPILQPADLWKESGRWDVYGKELMRLQDRHGRDCVLAPTHEEVITAIARNEVKSYRNLPVNLYQIQNKYRDEVRPRFGLLRAREFVMKDAYSFHVSDADLDREYEVMAAAYTRIFERCGLETVMVRSDSGAIGGSVSHEFMVLTRIAPGEPESGENVVFYTDDYGYAANADRAESILPPALTDGSALFATEQEVETPNCDTIEALCRFLNCPPSLICKAMLYIRNEREPFLALIRGDLEVEETRLKNAVLAQEIRLATAEEIQQYTGAVKGYVGGVTRCVISGGPLNESLSPIANNPDVAPTHLLLNNRPMPVIFDASVLPLRRFVMADNRAGFHTVGAEWPWTANAGASAPPPFCVRDIKLAREGDLSPDGSAQPLRQTRGIEVGNIFKLGVKYSERMDARYMAEDGTEQPFIMGCYGIGVTRTAAAAVERFHDVNGIVWPMAIAPYHAIVIPVNTFDETQITLARRVYAALQAAGVETVFDDRDERAGVKFKDADLIGFPIRITAGKKAAEGLLEVRMRDGAAAADIPEAQVVEWARAQMASWRPFADCASRQAGA